MPSPSRPRPLRLHHAAEAARAFLAVVPTDHELAATLAAGYEGRSAVAGHLGHARDRAAQACVAVFGWSSGAALALGALARSTMGSAAAIYEPSVSEVIDEQDAARRCCR